VARRIFAARRRRINSLIVGGRTDCFGGSLIGGKTMNLSTNFSPLASLVFGILILMFPKFLNYLIAIYLIIVGIIGLGLLG